MTGVMLLLEQLGEYVVTWTWQSAAVVLLACCVVRLDRRNRPSLRFRLWSVALICVLLLPWAPRVIASLSWTQELKRSWKTSNESLLQLPTINESASMLPAEVSVAGETGSTPIVQRAATTWLQLAGLSWVLGTTFAAIRRQRAHTALRRIVKRGTRVSPAVLTDTSDWSRRTPSVVLSPQIDAPMLYGWFDPVILLPQDIYGWSTPEERLLMICHECIHHQRRHHWISAVAAAVRTLLFFHPLVYRACRQLDIEREFACDERMLELGFEPEAYGEALIKVAEHAVVAESRCGSVAFASAATLNARIDRLFRSSVRVMPAALALLPALFLLMPIAALGFWQARPPSVLAEVRLELQGAARIITAPPAALSASKAIERVRLAMAPLPQAKSVLPEAEPLGVRTDQLKQSESSTLVLITVQVPFRNMGFVQESGFFLGSGRIETTVTQINGQVVSLLEDYIDTTIPARLFKPDAYHLYQARRELPPGLYKLDVLFVDGRSGKEHLSSRRLAVEGFPQGLSTSLLVLADAVEVTSLQTAAAPFQIGSLKVRPSLKEEFRRDRDLSFAIQIYGLSTGAATIQTSIASNGVEVRRLVENVQGASNMTMTKTLPLADFDAGDYYIQVTVTDTQSGEATSTKGEFRVR